ncbi:MAG: c-type cytochrome [Rugosibacter sp.]|nr:c-type cytochrome [Rugosibacter sp.]
MRAKISLPQILLALLWSFVAHGLAHAGAPWQAIGRPATSAEIKAWDIDVRGDFVGLPKGHGSVAEGEPIWEAKCASCHGTFGESNEVFTPIVGGTTEADIKTGHVASLSDGKTPQRTTLMKASKLSTLWDFINRAMPWNAPKSLSSNEVYAVTAYMLNLGGIVSADFVLTDANMADVQKRLPNRNGVVRFDGLWDVRGKTDVANTACMKNCPTEAVVHSSLPAHARNAHGNIAEQNRLVGGVRGTNTTLPEVMGLTGNRNADHALLVPPSTPEIGASVPSPVSPKGADVAPLLSANGCNACHSVDKKILGPAFKTIAKKYAATPDAENYLAAKIKNGGSGIWGGIPMPAQAQVKAADVKAIAQWIAAGAY